jgi:hypothetical protein
MHNSQRWTWTLVLLLLLDLTWGSAHFRGQVADEKTNLVQRLATSSNFQHGSAEREATYFATVDDIFGCMARNPNLTARTLTATTPTFCNLDPVQRVPNPIPIAGHTLPK